MRKSVSLIVGILLLVFFGCANGMEVSSKQHKEPLKLPEFGKLSVSTQAANFPLPFEYSGPPKIIHNEGSIFHGIVSSDGEVDNRRDMFNRNYYRTFGFKKSDLFAVDFSLSRDVEVRAIADGIVVRRVDDYGYLETGYPLH